MGLRDTFTGIFSRKQSLPGTQDDSYNYGSGNHKYRRVREYHGKKLNYHQIRKVSKDPQVKVGWDILNYFLLSKSYILTSASDDPEDVAIKEFIEDMLENMTIPFREVDKNLNTAIKYGFSANERVYTLNHEGKIVIDAIYPIHMRTLQDDPFVFDAKGELVAIHQESDYGTVDIPIEKIMLYSFDAEFDEVQGNSIMTEIADFTNDKKSILNWLLTYLHKHENPILYAKVAKGSAAKAIRKALDAISGGKTNITVGQDDELGVLESSHRGDTFFKALTLFDNYIFRRFYLGNLALGDPSQTGSYSQSETQMKMSHSVMNGIQEDKANSWQRLINEIVEMNFGISAKKPKFAYESFTEKDYLNLVNTLKDLVTDGVIDYNSPWWKELIATTVQKESGVKVDTHIEDDIDDTDYGYQPPLPGDDQAQEILAKIL